MVAEILFRGLLTETVEYSALTPGGYTKGETLGMREFKLEEIEGVIVGNEFADLNSDQVLAEGKTALQVEGEDAPRTLNITSLLTDVGESRLVYTQNTSKVLSLADTGKNKVTEFGHACDISTPSKFNDVAEMPAASDIEYYRNFDRAGYWTSDYRIEYELTNSTWVGDTQPNLFVGNEGRWTFTNANARGEPTATSQWTYHKLIPATDEITSVDYDNIRNIFYWSNGRDTGGTDPDRDTFYPYSGKVYVGTQTTKDISDEISWSAFLDKYINDERYDVNWNISYNGQWVKFVDNNGDGQCDYAFLTHAFLDEVVGTYKTKDGDTVMQYNSFDDLERPEGYTVRYMDKAEPVERDVEIEDKVIATWIDNQYLIGHADSVTKTVNKYNWKDDIITTTDGDEYGQSQIGNATDMMQWLSDMDEKTEYVMYLDSFGYVRAFELPGGTNYALVTELYYTNANIGNLVQNWPMTVELWNGEEGKNEYSVNNSNPFNVNASRGDNNLSKPFAEVRSIASSRNYYNWLQPAIAHLGVGREGFGPDFGVSAVDINDAVQYTFWNKNYQLVNTINNLNGSTEFNYGTQSIDDADRTPTTSYTNVAIANIGDGTADIKGAAQLKLDRNGNIMFFDANGNGVKDAGERWRYAVDYVQLTTDDVAAGQVRYPIANSPAGNDAANNYYVNAVHDTEFYVVYNGDVFYTKDYANMVKLTNEDNVIHAAYAVARDTSADNADKPYWVADVIVYEVQTLPEAESATSISLAYFNPSRTTGNVQLLETLNSKSEDPMINIVPKPEGWNADKGSFGSYSGYGFYELINETLLETGELAASKITPIVKDFNSKGIYAGILTREVRIATDGSYIDVNLTGARNGDGTLKTEASVKILSNIYSITQDTKLSSSNGYFNEANVLQYSSVNWSEVQAGDRVIWVGGGAGKDVSKASFIVDLSHGDSDIYNNTAAFVGYHLVPSPADWDPAPIEGAIPSGYAGSNLGNTADADHPWAGWPLWAAINKEQKDALRDTWTVNYTFVDQDEEVLANLSAPADEVLKLDANAANILTPDIADSAAPGTEYDVIGVTVTSIVDGAYNATASVNDAGEIVLTNIKGDEDVNLRVQVVPSASRISVIVKADPTTWATVAGAGVAVPADIEKIVPATGGSFNIASLIPNVKGLTITAAVTGGTTQYGSATVSIPGKTLALSGTTAVGGPQTVTLTYGVSTSFSLVAQNATTANTALTGVTIGDMDLIVTPIGAATETIPMVTMGTTPMTAAAKYDGAAFTISFPGNPLYTYEATVTNGTLDGTPVAGKYPATVAADGTVSFTGTITGATVVSITETAKPATALANVIWAGYTKGTDGNVTVGGADATDGTAVPGQPLAFVTAPEATYEVYSVTWTLDGVSHTLTATTANNYQLPAEALVANKTTVVTVSFGLAAGYSLTPTITGYTGGAMTYSVNGDTKGELTAAAVTGLKPGDVIEIYGNGGVGMTVTSTGAGALPASAIVTSDDGMTTTITLPSTFKANTTITIVDKT
nr:hypothetical protein [uncultured Acetatifactor sp.]